MTEKHDQIRAIVKILGNDLGNDINIIVMICVWIITLWDFIVIIRFMGFVRIIKCYEMYHCIRIKSF